MRHQCAPRPPCTRRRTREETALQRLRTGCSAMMRLRPRRVPLPMRARFAYVSSRATPGARKHRSTGLSAAMRCIWVALPTSLPMSAIYGAPLAVRGGRPKPPIHSPQHAMHMVSRRHSLPRTTTPRPGSTTTPRPRDRLHTFYRSVARGCSSQTPRMRLRMPHGRNCHIATCIGLPSIPGKADAGGRSGYACAAMPPLMKTIPCYSTCQNHRPAPRTAPGGSRWTCASSAAGGFAAEGPHQKCCPARANASRSQIHLYPHWSVALRNHQHLCRPPLLPKRPGSTRARPTTLLPETLLHAAVGRLHSSALAAWEAHALLPESLMTLLSLNIVAVLALPSSHCWTHSRAHLQPGFSLYVLLFLSSPSTRPFSECYCSADSDCLYR